MNYAEIQHVLIIRAEPSSVYRAVTETKGVQNWWTRTASAEPVVNSLATFTFGARYHNEMQVTRLDPDERVEWICLVGDPEWIDTRFSFDLEPHAEGTLLRFKHSNWREATDFFGHCNYHWGYYLRSLKLYCETGEGTPFGRS